MTLDGERHEPLLLRPSGKDYLWGGKRLNEEFAKNINMYPLAETWECSTHPDGPSFVAAGEYAGKSLALVLKEHPEYLGRHANENGELPILIKFIDAKENLAVQVHPDDVYARENESGQRGKTEMWYVLDAAENASFVYGLSHKADKEQIRRGVADGTVGKYLQKVPVKKDNVFFIEAGTIHALGAGTLVAEIQENSNLTYRLYDYGRTDKNGNFRELHMEKALDVARLEAAPEPRQPLRVLKYTRGMASELLCHCRYFEVYRILLNTESDQQAKYSSDEISYRVLLCIDGTGEIRYGHKCLRIKKGDCVFVPSRSVELGLFGKMQLLDVRG